jgi:hypothetical protein
VQFLGRKFNSALYRYILLMNYRGTNAKLADLQKESEDKRFKNLPPRDRMRLKKQEQADEQARRMA